MNLCSHAFSMLEFSHGNVEPLIRWGGWYIMPFISKSLSHTQPFYTLWTSSGTTCVSWYQKEHFAVFWIFCCKMKITQVDGLYFNRLKILYLLQYKYQMKLCLQAQKQITKSATKVPYPGAFRSMGHVKCEHIQSGSKPWETRLVQRRGSAELQQLSCELHSEHQECFWWAVHQ